MTAPAEERLPETQLGSRGLGPLGQGALEPGDGRIVASLREVHRTEGGGRLVSEGIGQVRLRRQPLLKGGSRLVQLVHLDVGPTQLKQHRRLVWSERGRFLELRDRPG